MGFRDVGGEILEVVARDGSRTYPASLAHVTGTIYDSTKAVALSGVRVTVAGTDFWSTTDRSGEFHLAVPLEGDYGVTFSHPWLDSIGFRSPEQKVNLAREMSRSVAFEVPPVGGMIERLCGEGAGASDLKTVVGVVEGEEGNPIEHAEVEASWQELVPTEEGFEPVEFRRTDVTDDQGFFAVCGLPAGRPLTVSAERQRETGRIASIIFPRVDDGRLLLARDRAPGERYEHSYSAPHPIWKVDFDLEDRDDSRSDASELALLSGIVADRMTGYGLEAVTVSVNNADTAVTRDDGTFDVTGFRWLTGANIVSFRRLGYRQWVQGLNIEDDRSDVTLSVLLQSAAIALEPVEVSAEVIDRYLSNVGFIERRERGLGHFVDQSAIEMRVNAAEDFADLMVAVPGLRVTEVVEPVEGLSGKLLTMNAPARAGGYCTPRIYLDGVPTMYDGSVADLAGLARPEDIIAIEIYRRSSEVPAQFSDFGEGCAILMWTRRGIHRRP
jgi:hypothetical protein